MSGVATASNPLRRRQERRFLLFVAPWLLGALLIQALPMLVGLALSFTDWSLVRNPDWRGLVHWQRMLDDPILRHALRNSLVYCLLSVPTGVALAFVLALLVNLPWRGMGLFRTVLLMPALVSGTAVALVWGWLFNPRFGVVNGVLRAVHLPTPGWLSDPRWALSTLALLSLWSIGGTVLIYLGGLRTVPPELLDAARLDGANRVQVARAVILPLVSPVTYFLLIIGTIMGLQLFAPVYVLTEGGPRDSTMTLPLYIYLNAFRWSDYGYAAALSVVLVALTLLLTLVQVTVSRRWVFYTGGPMAER